MRNRGVILLPGSVLPAGPAYGALINALGGADWAHAKDLEVYAGPKPPPNYSLDNEIDGVLQFADELGYEQFHLVGYSGGGASALAVAAKHRDRLRSLALLEPAWAGNWRDRSVEHQELWAKYDDVARLPDAEFMAAFAKIALRPGLEPPPPPPGEPPPWMSLRPAGIRAFLNTFKTYDLDRAALQRFDRPVYYGLGELSNPDEYEEIANRLAEVFSDYRLEVFANRHHFDPPHRIEPERVAASLTALWDRADAAQ